MLYIIRGVWGVGLFRKPWAKPNLFVLCRGEENVCFAQPQAAVLRSSLSLIPIFRPLQVRATPAVFPAVIRGLPLIADCPVRQLAVQRSSSGLRVILQSLLPRLSSVSRCTHNRLQDCLSNFRYRTAVRWTRCRPPRCNGMKRRPASVRTPPCVSRSGFSTPWFRRSFSLSIKILYSRPFFVSLAARS